MSAINEELKSIFIHIPKTAGTSMEERGFLGTVMSRHYSIEDYFNQTPIVDFTKYFKFAFVRNPYDRLRSAICEHPMKHQKITRNTFSQFIFDNPDMLVKWTATKPQYSFIYLKGELAVDFVGKFENLKEDWKKVCDKLGQSSQLGMSRQGSYPRDDLYTPQARGFIAKLYKKDFEEFGYEK